MKKALFIPILLFSCFSLAAQGPSAADLLASGKQKLDNMDHPAALADLTQSLDLDKKNPETHFYVAEAKLNMKDSKGAMLSYNRSIRYNPKYAEAFKQRGKLKEIRKKIKF